MKRNLTLIGSAIAIFCMICVYTTAFAASGDKFGLKDIPEIKNKQPLSTMVETGQAWDKIMPYIEAFTKETGVKVNVERVASPVVYSKENIVFLKYCS